MDIGELLRVGTKVYDCKRWINYRFLLVFAVRCMLHHKEVGQLQAFFRGSDFRRQVMQAHPMLYAQLTRQVIYRDSDIKGRLRAIIDTFAFMERHFSERVLSEVYLDEADPLILWSTEYEGQQMTVQLFFRNVEIREGALTFAVALDGRFIYHVNFWLWQEPEGLTAYIGCHQGSKEGLAINKALTKHFFGYRPKNLVLYGLRVFLAYFGISRLKAVSNHGFYANNHFRRNRKLKVSYDKFWEEAGGTLTDDPRFYELPIDEKRKTQEQLPPKKRAKYRRRYEYLDEFKAALMNKLLELSK